MDADPALAELVRGHAARCWPGRRIDVVRWEEGGLVENLPDLAVVRVAPAQPDGVWTLLTAGASIERMEDGYGLELVLLAPTDDKLAVKLISMVAHLHADARYPLSHGQVLEIGHPWLPGASCDHLLVSLLDAFEPGLEWYSDTERNVRFVWLVPLTAAEAELARRDGLRELRARMSARQVDPAELQRESAV